MSCYTASMILAVDFDGVLHNHKELIKGRRIGAPIAGAKQAMEQLKAQRHTLIIFSVWGDKPKVIEDWCSYWQIPYDEVTNIKPNADVYIDDRAIRFINWEQTLLALDT